MVGRLRCALTCWLAVAGAVSCAVPGAAREICPAEIREATQLLIATTPTPDRSWGRIALYQRAVTQAAWTRAGDDIAMVTGLKGLAWGWTARALARAGERFKREGDKRTPAGVFRIGRPFGAADDPSLEGFMVLRRGETFCVDDVRSPYYGQIVPRARAGKGVSGEVMAQYGIYRRGIVVSYPPNALKKAGSCIFIHVWRGPKRGTAGCLAAREADVIRLQRFTSGQPSAIVIVSETARRRLVGCLPN